MRTLVLTSEGMQVKGEILKILPKPPNQLKVAYITTALNGEEDGYQEERDKDGRAMRTLGFDVERMDLEGKNEQDLREMFQRKDIIYVQGGNTFYLLKQVKESGFDKVIKDLLEQGVIYIGVSAASIIMCPVIETASWYFNSFQGTDENKVGLQDITGLSMVPFNIYVHYLPEDAEEVKRQSATSQYPVRILTNDQAFLVQDDNITLIGKGEEVRV